MLLTLRLARYIRKNVEWGEIIYSEKETHYTTIKLHFFGRSNNDIYKGIGAQFLMHFLYKCYELTQVIGVALITLECKTDLKPYYEENGFKCIGSVGERKNMVMIPSTSRNFICVSKRGKDLPFSSSYVRFEETNIFKE